MLNLKKMVQVSFIKQKESHRGSKETRLPREKRERDKFGDWD